MASSKDFTEGGRMTFLTLMGGLLVFGFLWLVFPRAAFAVALAVISSQFLRSDSVWDAFAAVFLVCGVIFGAILDIAEGQQILEG